MKKQVRRFAYICIIFLFLFTACKTAADSPVDIPLDEDEATEHAYGDGAGSSAPVSMSGAESKSVQSKDFVTQFHGGDSNVTINIDLRDIEYPVGPMPTIRVTPYRFTAEDAKRVADVLFGDAVLFERARELTQEEVEHHIAMYEGALTEEALYGGYGSDEQSIETIRQERQELLDYFRGLSGSAQPKEPCQWTFYPFSHYLPDPSVKVWFHPGYHYLSDADSVKREGDDIQLIAALAECPDGRIYSYQVLNTETEDKDEHIIFAYLESSLDSGMMREPTDEDLENIRREAETWLSEMGFGRFAIEKVCPVSYTAGLNEGYVVSISAVPVYSGQSALHQTKLAGAGFTDGGVHLPKYDPQHISFHFTADGVLLDFKYVSPLTVVEVMDGETPIIGWEEARESIEQRLRLDKEPFSVMVDVNVNEIAFGLARVYVENATDFRLIPALILRGHRVIYDEDGNVNYTAGMPKTSLYDGLIYDEGYESDLLTISLVDGSVIVQKAFSAQDIDILY